MKEVFDVMGANMNEFTDFIHGFKNTNNPNSTEDEKAL